MIVPKSIIQHGAVHTLIVTNSQAEDSLVRGGIYLAGIRVETLGGIGSCALTRSDVEELRDFLTALLEQS